ncbi:hypothetical protein [Dysgonomonas sp. BGC7]|uniref:hypothetical protein n=1 Tax=Dysgonomonas sp. BGC7 TaxID=1658008 RepID=UPI000682360A|nr:hypothetical protein [Dysgonomonas sp. BGC7]MBD8389645.1 hypothetical protein [Dysgonomonas sp. BGC7]
MEMPVPCDKCGEWVELNSTRQSETDRNKLYCESCYEVDNEVDTLHQEILDLEYDLDNDAEHMKGQRREYKKEIKEKRARIAELGYDYEDL